MEETARDKEQKKQAIDLRSEEVQEIIGNIPSWILRWGITLVFVIVIVFLIGSFFLSIQMLSLRK